MTYKTVSDVADADLCLSCGTCESVCPASAINLEISKKSIYEPIINHDKCINCKMCLKVCPGISVDFEELNNDVFDKQPDITWIGNFVKCYLGNSRDEIIRYNSTSGGMVTQILDFLLEKGIIDGALVTGMSKDRPLEPNPFIARTKDEILSAAVSKYCPVPLNRVLKKIMNEEGKFAVVGLPCHIHGIRMLEKTNRNLRDKIVLHIGLLCSHTVNFNGTEFLLAKKNIQKKDIVKLSYRGNGWPGRMSIRYKDGSGTSIPFDRNWFAYWTIFSPYFFTPLRCITCTDLTAELADISLGDAWLPELMNDTVGMSIVISRTEKSESIINNMCDENKIYIRGIHHEDVKRSQGFNIKYKKLDLGDRMLLLSSSKHNIPYYNPSPSAISSLVRRIRNLFVIFNVKISSRKKFMKYLVKVPIPIFRLYTGVSKVLYDLDS